MDKIYIVYLVLAGDTPQDRFYGIFKEYAIFTKPAEAADIQTKLQTLGESGLKKLKILKQDDELMRVTVSQPFAVDNYDAINRKLSAALDSDNGSPAHRLVR